MLPSALRVRERATIVVAVRRFFARQGFIEVDTPVAARTVAPEPHLDAPRVELHVAGATVTRYLQTSPELAMKRLLALGLERIFQIAPVFRDGDFTRWHRPEFRILEWYRRDAGVTSLMQDCEDLVRFAAEAAGKHTELIYQGRPFTLSGSWPRVTVDEACLKYAGFSLLEHLDTTALAARLRELGIHFDHTDSWDDLFHRLLLTRIEPRLVADYPVVFLTNYPAPLASLARLSADDPRVAERFELYIGGMELANGYGELVDAHEQRRRFERDRALRRAAGMQDYPTDELFFAALTELPPSAGIALGLDRLLMLLLDAGDIDEVACIPWSEE